MPLNIIAIAISVPQSVIALGSRLSLDRIPHMKTMLLVVCALVALSSSASAECIAVKYRDGCVQDRYFACSITESSLVKRVCYDRSEKYMVIKLQAVDYHYCGIDADTVGELLTAPSKGKFYNERIKGRFDCRTGTVPTYQ